MWDGITNLDKQFNPLTGIRQMCFKHTRQVFRQQKKPPTAGGAKGGVATTSIFHAAILAVYVLQVNGK